MASETPCDEHMNEYMLFRHEKISLLDLLGHLIFRRLLTSCKFVESSSSVAGRLEGVPTDWITVLTCILQKILSVTRTPMKWIGRVVEFLLNLVSLNGGVRGLIWNVITVSVTVPKRGAANFRSCIAHLDERIELRKSHSWIHSFSSMDTLPGLGETDPLDLSMMAAKVAYENYAYIKDAVTNHWKMHFVGYYSCWNKFLEDKTTQAFIFCNKAKEADLIVLAFRGTEPFNAHDWCTDIDLSWRSMGKLGNVHLGFLKALGLQDETADYQKGFPKDLSWNDDKPVAYYVLRDTLRTLLKKHKNAKILVTGHSLGGALAAVFPSLLALHEENDILDAIYGVMTYGQPRVGDATFKKYMESILSRRYYRMVYRYDIVPRIPFDMPPVALFTHCGTCMYYHGWYHKQAMIEEPNPNYFDQKYAIPLYLNALGDLIKALLLGRTQGKEFKEEFFSILYRASGLILPGVASHSPRDYVNGGRLAKISTKDS